MFRFQDPIYLWLLLLIPILAIVRIISLRSKRKKMKRFGDPALLAQLSPNVSKVRPTVKFWLLEAALALIIVMVARPQMGRKINSDKREGIETIIALDISNSMLAQDVSPSRLDKSKMMVENLVDHFNNDKIGLIVFAGDAFVQLPITSDYVSAKMFLQNIDPSLIQTQGTDIGGAINLAMHSFTQDTKSGKAIIIITDGEDHEGGAEEMAKKAHDAGINVYILGIGDPKGAPIPIGNGEFMKDKSGNTVMTALNEDMCKKVAAAGKGVYIHVDNSGIAEEQLDNELDKLQKGEINNVVYSDFDEQFQAVAIIVLLILIIEVLFHETKSSKHKDRKIFYKRHVAVLLLLLLAIQGANAQTDRDLIRQGNRLYNVHKYAEAEIAYRKAIAANPSSSRALYNLGCALQKENRDSDAILQYEQAVKNEPNQKVRSQGYYNTGVAYQTMRNYDKAIEAYKNCLRLNPNDEDARYNYVLCKRQQKQQQQNNGSNNKNNNNDKNKDKDKKNQDKNKQDQNKDKNQNQKNNQQSHNQNQPQNGEMSKENAEQLLQAAMNEESQTEAKLKKAMQQPSRRQLDKNW